MNLFHQRTTRDQSETFRAWSDHFDRKFRERGARALPPGPPLSEPDRQRVGPSIAEFARGESSEARDFLAKSKAFAARQACPAFHEASVGFIREENVLHARVLLAYMERQGVAPVFSSWADAVFRWIRNLGDAAWSSRVLLCAEILAQLYYPALRLASACPVLRAVCDDVIADESEHIAFQSDRIACLDRHASLVIVREQQLVAAVVFGATAVVLWWGHRDVLRCRFRFVPYFCEAVERFARVSRQIEERREPEGPAAGVTPAAHAS